MSAEERQRIDKWLWFARAAKTRGAAARLVGDGRVRVNKLRVEAPAHAVKRGDVLTIGIGGRVLVWRVVAFGARRGPPAEARALYEDLSPARDEMPPSACAERRGALAHRLEEGLRADAASPFTKERPR